MAWGSKILNPKDSFSDLVNRAKSSSAQNLPDVLDETGQTQYLIQPQAVPFRPVRRGRRGRSPPSTKRASGSFSMMMGIASRNFDALVGSEAA